MFSTKQIIGAALVILVLLFLYWSTALLPVIAILPLDVIILVILLILLVSFGLYRVLRTLLSG